MKHTAKVDKGTSLFETLTEAFGSATLVELTLKNDFTKNLTNSQGGRI